jgi:hypothetical protein
MGEYERLNRMIDNHKKEIKKIDEALANFKGSEDGRFSLLETKYELQVAIGEIEGALLEMAEIDGLDDPYEAFDYGGDERW